MSYGSSPPNYLDGVTVKISEKYKPPAAISVPSGLFERVSAVSADVDYDFTLESSVLRKLDEWRQRRRAVVTERNHRLQLKEEARQRRDDRERLEAEERLSQLAVSDVSYPTTEDDDDNVSSPKPTRDDILQPVSVASGHVAPPNLLDDLDSIRRFQETVKIKSDKFARYNRNNADELNFSDFENDTSSPFDNMELKTINDIELLAQVLNCAPSTNVPTPSYSIPYQPQQTYCPYNYAPPETSYNAYYPPNYTPYTPSDTYRHVTYDRSALYNQQLAYSNNGPPVTDNNTYNYVYAVPLNDRDESAASDALALSSKSRSKSVPDIVKELDEELAKARLRSNERSHNCSPAPNKIPEVTAVAAEKLPNPFDNLSPRLQFICRYINGMGFPLDRVARACEKIGDDDKKIIEFLLNMDKLMDLGFHESSVANALLQHNCNREKALDELIS